MVGHLAFDLSELNGLHVLEFPTTGASTTPLMEAIRGIIDNLSTTSRDLRDLTLRFVPQEIHGMFTETWGDEGLATVWGGQSFRQQCHLVEESILARTSLRLTVSIPKAKRNRHSFWSEVMQGCFPRLHEHGLLQVQCTLGAC